MNVSDVQNSLVVGGNVQQGVPTQQSDPTIIPNAHYLPNGDLTICSDQNFDNWTINTITIPIATVAGLFRIETDSNEPNLVEQEDVEYTPTKYTPHLQTSMPNIAQFIGMLITGADIDQRFLESILTSTAAYLDGIMEILANGTFMYLNQQRDGTNRRYSQLCMIINYAISSVIYPPMPPNSEIAMEQQAMIQTLYQTGATSALFTLRDAVVNSNTYIITKAMLNRWAMTTPWHALIYNSQAPLTLRAFITLFNNIFSINCGKRLTSQNSFIGQKPTTSMMPNFDLFTNLTPPGMRSSTFNISTKIPQRFITFLRYLLYTESNELEWFDDEDEDTSDASEGEDDQAMDTEGEVEELSY